ncbi:uncharacterized protein LOC101856513 [Aplysia californica]|uniref:Uncharacterized protein LOC101856513 n=1 Tax=Aplysia californica TaxID=6500 RepID=A0ABM1A0J9_APLCA|nr:uncharacterized protein LOC101856513 [Aplysia californica]XP_012938380.1 uncharacterized protein LOC101856513 [Aplysia californica]
MVRARLAIMQFKRQRLPKAPSQEELARRRNLGIWSYNGGTSIGPLQPGKASPRKKQKRGSNQASTNGNNRETGDSEPNTMRIEEATEEESTTDPEKGGDLRKEPTKNADGDKSKNTGSRRPPPLTQLELVSEVNKAPVVKFEEKSQGKKFSIDSSRSTMSSNLDDVTLKNSKSEPSLDDNANSIDMSRPSSQGTESVSPTNMERESKRPGSSRKLFTHVTPNVHLSRNDSSRFSKDSSDLNSVKSLGNEKVTRISTDNRPKSSATKTLHGKTVKSSITGSVTERNSRHSAPNPKSVKPITGVKT